MSIENYYRRFRPKFEESKAQIPRRIEKVVELLPENGANILDVGCNIGVFSQLYKKKGNNVYGIEINEELANEAKQRIDKVIVQSAERKWRVNSCYFDVVNMGAILEHIFDYHFVLNEANRVLKHKGLLIISVPNLACVINRIKLLVGEQPIWYREFQHIRVWTKPWLEKTLEIHGFTTILWLGALSSRHVPLKNRLEKLFPSFFSILICKAEKLRDAKFINSRLRWAALAKLGQESCIRINKSIGACETVREK